jgi:hypothetical protein
MNFSSNMVATRSLKRAVNSHKLGYDIGSLFVAFLVLAKCDRRYCHALKKSGIVMVMDEDGMITITYGKTGVILYLNLESVLKLTVG